MPRPVQTQRLEGTSLGTHAELDEDLLEAHAPSDEAGNCLLIQIAEAMRLSARTSKWGTPQKKAKAALLPAIQSVDAGERQLSAEPAVERGMFGWRVLGRKADWRVSIAPAAGKP